jgi:8-oxo-dGTP pyrophosphatase MutT (NUDIX family)
MVEPKYKDLHRVVGTVIIHRDGKYLITKRSDKLPVFPGLWTVPGGGLETDDYINLPPSFQDGQWYNALDVGLRRELIEEVNLEVGELSYLTNIAFIRPDGKPCLVLSFFAPYKSGDIKLSAEDSEYKWVTADEAGKYKLIPGIDEEIRQVDKILRKK